MSGPVRITVPIAGETIATITSYPELVEAFRQIKATLGLSNKWCDDTCDFQEGYTDKVLGPSQNKSISPLTFSMFCTIFAVKFRMEIDLDAVRKMEERWEKRAEGQVAFPEWRISKRLVEKAKPYVLRNMGAAGGRKRASRLSAKRVARISRKGAISLNKKLKPSQRRANARKAGLASAAKRAAIAAERAAMLLQVQHLCLPAPECPSPNDVQAVETPQPV